MYWDTCLGMVFNPRRTPALATLNLPLLHELLLEFDHLSLHEAIADDHLHEKWIYAPVSQCGHLTADGHVLKNTFVIQEGVTTDVVLT